MQQRLDFLTIATADLDAARRFYVDGLGWSPLLDVAGEILFVQVGPGLVLGLYDRAHFSADLGAGSTVADVPGGFTLSHNVGSAAEVDAAVARLAAVGARVLKPPQPAAFGGHHGHVQDPVGVVWEVAHNPGWRVLDDGTVVLDPPPDVPRPA